MSSLSRNRPADHRLANPTDESMINGYDRMRRRHADIFERVSHFAFYPVDPVPHQCDVAFRYYYDFIPAGEHDTAWMHRGQEVIRFTRNNQDTRWLSTGFENRYLLENDGDDHAVLPPEGDGLYAAMQEELDRCHELLPKYQKLPFTTGQAISSSLYERLCGDNHSLYDFHKSYSFEELLEMDGIGKKTAVALKHPGRFHTNEETDAMDACVIAVCPACAAEWKAPIFPDVEATDSSMPQIVYCPVCENNDIPPSYISDPQPFNPTERVTIYNFEEYH